MNKPKYQKALSSLKYLAFLIGSSIVLLIVGHFFLFLVIESKNLISVDHRADSPVYDEYEDYRGYWKEHRASNKVHFEPYIHWRRDEFSGDYINIDEFGIRKTIGSVPNADSKKVYIFGGSTIWGTGTKDEHTIPSFLQAKFGTNYRVLNFGETAFVSTQELNSLLYQLSIGNIPDVVIFYDGVNDGYTGVYSPAEPRGIHNLRMLTSNEKKLGPLQYIFRQSNYFILWNYLSRSLFSKKITETWDSEIAATIDSNAEQVVDLYNEHISQVNSLAKAYGFQAYFFWQPHLFGGKDVKSNHETIIVSESSEMFVQSQYKVYRYAKSKFQNRESEGVYFLGDIFNETDKPIYFDWCHIGPDGNEIIADTIKTIITAQLVSE